MSVPVVCQYAGIIQLKIRTLTAAYANFTTPWTFSPNAMQPMDFIGYYDGALTVAGCQGNIFDSVTGITNFIIGNPAGTIEGNATFGALMWTNNRLRGFLNLTNGFGKNAYGIDVPCVLGVGINQPIIPYKNLKTYPVGANTGTPDPRCGQNFICSNGVYSSGEMALVQEYLIWPPNAGLLTSNPGFTLGFAPGNGLAEILTTGLLNYARQGTTLHQTDFLSFTNDITFSFQNPPGGFDLNAFLTGGGVNYSVTYNGWLVFNSSTQTIDGRNLPGFGILMKPDMSQYVIIQIVPTDAGSVAWNSGGGGGSFGKFDSHGNLFLKQLNVPQTIFISTGFVPLFRNLPVYPPVALPAAMPDTEKTLTMYRGT